MRNCIITFRSVTPAQRGERALQRAGIRGYIRRTPGWMEHKGCGYSLRVSCDQIGEAVELLRIAGIRYGKIYRFLDEKRLEEVEL